MIKNKNIDRLKRKSSEARSSLMVFPNDTNDFGTMYGGRLIELMDVGGFVHEGILELRL